MNQEDIGKFIAKHRKEKGLTQAQLAEMLSITDRAVSKWETGKSMPDSSIMLELCEILGVSVNELLSGEEVEMENYGEQAEKNLIEMKRREENNLKKNGLILIIFSAALLIGIMVCLICDIAISGEFTWSLIPLSSILFAWVVCFPVIILGKKGITAGLLSLSVFILPYLYILSVLVKAKEVFSIGAVMSVITMAYLWLITLVFRRWKERKLSVAGITCLLSIPFMLLINITLSKMISEPIIDIWDILSAFILLVLAFTFFVCGYARKRAL